MRLQPGSRLQAVVAVVNGARYGPLTISLAPRRIRQPVVICRNPDPFPRPVLQLRVEDAAAIAVRDVPGDQALFSAPAAANFARRPGGMVRVPPAPPLQTNLFTDRVTNRLKNGVGPNDFGGDVTPVVMSCPRGQAEKHETSTYHCCVKTLHDELLFSTRFLTVEVRVDQGY